jgi:hypothetical protein
LECITILFAPVIIFNFEIEHVLAVLIPAIILLLPVLFRTARIIWLNIFVNFDSERAELARQKKSGSNQVS